MTKTTESLMQQFRVDIRPITLDLGASDPLSELISVIEDLEVGLLVNSAEVST
jgi:short-subunit dehydrogenase